MKIAGIKSGMCVMIVDMSDDEILDFKNNVMPYDYDDVVNMPEEPEFWIGDLYADGTWSHPVPPEEPKEPIAEEG